MVTGETGPRVEDEFTYRGIEAVFLENAELRVLILPGKGGDVLEFRDKQADIDVLWHADHDWQPPAERRVPTVDADSGHDHYPGGWQVNLPAVGEAPDFEGTPYGLHGESALLSWTVRETWADESAAVLRIACDLVRSPLWVERELRLPAGEPSLLIEETVHNDSPSEVPYVWQHHLALGPPLVGPEARLDVPAATGVVEPYGDGHANNRLAGDRTFEWPSAPGVDGGSVDLTTFPSRSAEIHDVAYATDLHAGWYAVTNPALDLGFGFRFPSDPFESVWYWQAFGGHEGYPYWKRNYTAGLEPTTAYPASDVPAAQRRNGTLKQLDPSESLSASFVATTYRGVERVGGIDADGTVTPR